MRWLLIPLLACLACSSSQGLRPVPPVAIDWSQCPAPLSIPAPPGGWKEERWVWREDSQLIERNNHACIDAVAKNSEENQKRVRMNDQAYQQKRASLPDRIGYWMEGAAISLLGGIIIFLIVSL